MADRVIFVGPHSGHVDKLRQSDLRERLLSFQTAYQAGKFLSNSTIPGEIVYVKSSLAADHLERIMLSQLEEVVCWREGCGKNVCCPSCRDYRTAAPPPFGLDHEAMRSADANMLLDGDGRTRWLPRPCVD